MDKISIISSLRQIADTLDNNSLYNQAEKLTDLMVKIAQITTGGDERDLEKLENEQILSRLKDVPLSGDAKPELASGPGNIIDVNDKKFVIPSNLTMEKTFDGKKFRLEINEENGNLYYIYREDNKPNLVVPVDKKNGTTQEVRGKGRVNLLRMFGIDKIFGKAKLPRLSPVEQYFRRKVVPEATKVVKPLGNAARDIITRPLLTDPLGAFADDLGLSTTGRDKPFMAGAKHQLGNSDDRSTVPTNVENSSTVDIKSESKFPEPTGPEPVEPSGAGSPGGAGGGMKFSKDQLQHIQSADDLLFWSMMVGNSYPYSEYNKDNEKQYYSSDNASNTLNYINKLTSSPWVEKINPQIKKYKAEAIEKLNRKTAGKNMNRQILASMNEICDELETLGMNKAASEMTEMMFKLAQNKKVTVCLIDGKPAVKIQGRKRPIFGPASGPFTSASHARSYAGKITPNFIDEIPANMMPGRSWRNQGPTGKPWTRDDQEMHDFEASREDKF